MCSLFLLLGTWNAGVCPFPASFWPRLCSELSFLLFIFFFFLVLTELSGLLGSGGLLLWTGGTLLSTSRVASFLSFLSFSTDHHLMGWHISLLAFFLSSPNNKQFGGNMFTAVSQLKSYRITGRLLLLVEHTTPRGPERKE